MLPFRRSARILSRASLNDARHYLLNTFSTKNLTVKHDMSEQLFFIELADERAVIKYEVIGKNILDLHHTEVPQVFQGLGVAKVLAKAAFAHCVENDLKMKLTCEYLQKYYRENPNLEYSCRIVEND